MKKEKNHSRKKHGLFPILLLAVLCIGGVELAVCYFFAPDLYRQVTAPLRRGAHAAMELADQAAEAASARWEALTTPKEDPDAMDDQLAGEPAILIDETMLSDPSLTELCELDGQQILTGGTTNVVYFNQGDPVWAEQPYGTDNIGSYGCGPTAMSMVVSSLTDEIVDPAAMARYAAQRGYCAKKRGSYLSIVNGISRAYGLTCEPIDKLTPEAMHEALLAGSMLVALMGPGHFTKGGHFIVLRGVTLTGTVLVADPNSEARSLMEWDPQLILDELSASTSNGAPLWVVSKPNA